MAAYHIFNVLFMYLLCMYYVFIYIFFVYKISTLKRKKVGEAESAGGRAGLEPRLCGALEAPNS